MEDALTIGAWFLVLFVLPLCGIAAIQRNRDLGSGPPSIDYDEVVWQDPPIVEPRGSVHGD